MEIQEVKRLIKLVENSGVSELELEEGGTRIRIVKHPQPNGAVAAQVFTPAIPAPASAQAQAPAQPDSHPPPAPAPVASNLIEIKSPMVGTFYRASGPDAPPYVKIGDEISAGQVLCIVEAMKLMNEIEAETGGRIIEILVQNAEPVQFGQVLFRIEPV